MKSDKKPSDLRFYTDLRGLLEEAIDLHGSVANLSRKAGINHSSLSDWLHGRQGHLSSETVGRLYDYLGLRLVTPRKRRKGS